jgi:hypothetical protein
VERYFAAVLGYSTGSQPPLGNYRRALENPVTLLSIECRNLRYLKSNAAEFGMLLRWRCVAD